MVQRPVEGQIAPWGHCSTSLTPSQIGALPPTPRPSCWGTSRGSSAPSSTPFSTFPVSLTEGVFRLFLFLVFCPVAFVHLFPKMLLGGRAGKGSVCPPGSGVREGNAAGERRPVAIQYFLASGQSMRAIAEARCPLRPWPLPLRRPSLPTPSPPCPSLVLVVLF